MMTIIRPSAQKADGRFFLKQKYWRIGKNLYLCNEFKT